MQRGHQQAITEKKHVDPETLTVKLQPPLAMNLGKLLALCGHMFPWN